MFGHLQIKSAYSFQRSTILIKDLVKMAKEKHIDALALCDKDNMYGAYEFYEECTKANIKPIFGLEATVLINGEHYPMTLLAIDDQGYFDLISLTSKINLSKERAIILDDLIPYVAHLLIISASDEGIVERLVLKDMEKEAEKYLRRFKEMFKDHYYIMIQNHHIALQKNRNERLIALAKYLNIKLLWGNDVCYLRKQDALAVDLMSASQEGRTLPVQYEVVSDERYLKSEEEIKACIPASLMEETARVVQMCKATIPQGIKNLPAYPTPANVSAETYLRELCKVGLKKRFKGQRVTKPYIERLSYELDVIHSMGFDDYFLIVWDYVQFSKKHHILVGPGRGSAAGSLVAYVLGITNVDPLAYDLLFERFLNPERVSMPDIDIDFQDDRRDEVVRYVIEKYGQNHVCQIVTFSTYGPRVAIKDIGKVMNVPLPRLEMIAKMVPTGPKNKKTITEVYQSSASFQSLINENKALRKLIGAMSVVEHLPRNISMHAAGVVLSRRPLSQSVPLVIGPSDMVMSQYSKDYIEKAGLLKMDFLGLKNLTMIDYILKDLHKEGYDLSLQDIPLNDLKTYEMLSRGDTFGVFQLESAGMRNLLRRMKPRELNDIIAAIALYRPGPMDNIPLYLKNRANPKEIVYLTEELKSILSSTYGIIIYQEQIMQIARIIAGFSLGKADMLRKAISKKNIKAMQMMKEEFIEGAINNRHSKEKAVEIYNLIEKFANYGFNKSHSVAYAIIAYQLAYLKANAPRIFFASILSNVGASSSTKLHCIQEAKKYGVKILSPSINKSTDRFTVEKEGIRYSLTAIKNVGYAGYRSISEEREKGPFIDLYDFLSRMEKTRMNKSMMDALIEAGAFDEFEKNRAYIKGNLDKMVEYVHLKNTIGVDEEPILDYIKEDRYRKLEEEKEVLGLYLTTHPLTYVKEKLSIPIVSLCDVSQYVGKSINVIMSISRVKSVVDKRGREMAFIEGQDDTSQQDCVCFSQSYERYKDSLKRGKIVAMEVRVQMRETLSLVVNKVKEIK